MGSVVTGQILWLSKICSLTLYVPATGWATLNGGHTFQLITSEALIRSSLFLAENKAI